MAYTTCFETCSISKGTMFELLVAADLLKRGFEVFKSVSHAASCDLIAHKDGYLIRIEVKGRRYAKRKKGHSWTKGYGKFKDCRQFDVLARVTGEQIEYSRSMHYALNPASEELVLPRINNLGDDSTIMKGLHAS